MWRLSAMERWSDRKLVQEWRAVLRDMAHSEAENPEDAGLECEIRYAMIAYEANRRAAQQRLV